MTEETRVIIESLTPIIIKARLKSEVIAKHYIESMQSITGKSEETLKAEINSFIPEIKANLEAEVAELFNNIREK